MASSSCQWPVERLNLKRAIEIVDVDALTTLQARTSALLLGLSNKCDVRPVRINMV